MKKVIIILSALFLILSSVQAVAASGSAAPTSNKKVQYYNNSSVPKQISFSSTLNGKLHGKQTIVKYDIEYGKIYEETTNYQNGVKSGPYTKMEIIYGDVEPPGAEINFTKVVTTATYTKGLIDGVKKTVRYLDNTNVVLKETVEYFAKGTKQKQRSEIEYRYLGIVDGQPKTEIYNETIITKENGKLIEKINKYNSYDGRTMKSVDGVRSFYDESGKFLSKEYDKVDIPNKQITEFVEYCLDAACSKLYLARKTVSDHLDERLFQVTKRVTTEYAKSSEIKEISKETVVYDTTEHILERFLYPEYIVEDKYNNSYICYKDVNKSSLCNGPIGTLLYKNGKIVGGYEVKEMKEGLFWKIPYDSQGNRKELEIVETINYPESDLPRVVKYSENSAGEVKKEYFNRNGSLAGRTVYADSDIGRLTKGFMVTLPDGSHLSGSGYVGEHAISFVAKNKDGGMLTGSVTAGGDYSVVSGSYEDGMFTGTILVMPELDKLETYSVVRGKVTSIEYNDELDTKITVIHASDKPMVTIKEENKIDKGKFPVEFKTYVNGVLNGEAIYNSLNEYGDTTQQILKYANGKLVGRTISTFSSGKKSISSIIGFQTIYYLGNGSRWIGTRNNGSGSVYSVPENWLLDRFDYKSFSCVDFKNKPCEGKQVYTNKYLKAELIFKSGSLDPNAAQFYTLYDVRTKQIIGTSRLFLKNGLGFKIEKTEYAGSKPVSYAVEQGPKTERFYIAQEGSKVNIDTLICVSSDGKVCSGPKTFTIRDKNNKLSLVIKGNYLEGLPEGGFEITHYFSDGKLAKNTIIKSFKAGKETINK